MIKYLLSWIEKVQLSRVLLLKSPWLQELRTYLIIFLI